MPGSFRPLLVSEVRRAHEILGAGNFWPTCQFEADEGRASCEPAGYCHQAVCLVDEVSRLIGLGWAADHFMSHVGLS